MAFSSAEQTSSGRDFPLEPMFLLDSNHGTSPDNSPQVDLITEKISRPVPSPLAARSRLLDMLEISLSSGTSTIITGRAGTGKTALAVDFANKCGRPVAWYKVDAPEADPRLFFQYLIAAIREQQPGFGAHALMPLIKDEMERINWLTDAFVYELAEGESAGPSTDCD